MKVRSLLVGLAVGSSLTLGACTSDAADTTTPSPSAAPMDWQPMPLPTGLSAVTLAATDTSVLVGAYGPGRPRPHLLSGTGAGPWQEVPLTPRSPYASQARWFQVATQGDSIDAIGGAQGGAHGNYRWSTWTGNTERVAEQEQGFLVFGGYGSGDLTGIAYAGASPVILGAWQSAHTGLDIATWVRTDDRWTRLPSTGTALASTPTELVAATAITSGGDGLVLSGSVTRLEPGSVTVEPAVWTSPDADGPWTRVGLPYEVPAKGSTLAQAHAATCTPHQCLVTGTVGGRFTMWEVGGNTAKNPSGIPDIEVTENASVLAPISLGGKDLFVVPSKDGTTLLQRSGEKWSVSDGPKGAPVSAVLLGDEIWVVTTDPQGTGTLWRARVA